MYAQVKFTLQEANAPIIIPENAFIFRSEGTQVAIADEHNRINEAGETVTIDTPISTVLPRMCRQLRAR